MINIEGANKYFAIGNHAHANVWNRFTNSNREGAVSSAIKVLSRALRRPLNMNELEYKQGDYRREEYAVYEQALHMLKNGKVSDASTGDAMSILTGTNDVAQVTESPLFAPEALRWLGCGSSAILRG